MQHLHVICLGPGSLGGPPGLGDTINDYPIIKCSPDVILCRYHVLITYFESSYT